MKLSRLLFEEHPTEEHIAKPEQQAYFLLERWQKLAGVVLNELATIGDSWTIEIRKKMNDFMERDQKLSNNPQARGSLQDEAWAYMNKQGVMDLILQDSGKNKDGAWPAASFAAWLMVQHMDGHVDWQQQFLSKLESAIPNHVKIQFLRDRVAVNQWMEENKDENNESGCGDPKLKGQPAINTRIKGLSANSREKALEMAEKDENKCLYNAVIATNAQTQPSFTQRPPTRSERRASKNVSKT